MMRISPNGIANVTNVGEMFNTNHAISRNCTKHSCRCDYMDQPPLAEEAPKSPRGLNLLFPPSIDAEIDNWMRSGIYPFPELALSNHMQFRNLQKIDLRLVHHVSQLYKDLQRMGVVHCTAWVEKLPVYISRCKAVYQLLELTTSQVSRHC